MASALLAEPKLEALTVPDGRRLCPRGARFRDPHRQDTLTSEFQLRRRYCPPLTSPTPTALVLCVIALAARGHTLGAGASSQLVIG